MECKITNSRAAELIAAAQDFNKAYSRFLSAMESGEKWDYSEKVYDRLGNKFVELSECLEQIVGMAVLDAADDSGVVFE